MIWRAKAWLFRKSHLGRRVLKGLSAHAYGQGVTIAIQLISVPVLIHSWGIEIYGLWLTLTAIPAYLALTDLGFSQVAASTLTMKVAANDKQGALETFASAFVLLAALTAAVAVGSAAFIAFAPLQSWLGHGAQVSVKPILMLITGQVLASVMTGLVSAGLRAEGRYALMTSISATTRLGTGLGVLAAALVGAGPVTAAAAMLVVQVASLVIAIGFLRRVAPWLKLDLSNAKQAEIRLSLGPSLTFGAYTFGNMLSLQGLVIVLATTLGPLAVAAVSVTRTLCRLGVTAGNMISFTLQPEYSVLFGRGDVLKFRSLMRRHMAVSGGLAAAYFTAMVGLGPLVLQAWTRGAVDVSRPLLVMLSGSCVLEILWMALFTPRVSINRHQTIGVLYLIISAGGLFMAGSLAPSTGVIVAGWHGLVVGTLMLLVCAGYGPGFTANVGTKKPKADISAKVRNDA